MSRDRRVAFSSKLAFGVGQLAEGLKNAGFAAFALYYYSQVLGVPGWQVGAALFIALLFDAVSDPFAGSVSDRWRSRLGRRHPFMYASALPLGVCFWLLFSPPAGLGPTGLTIWLAVFSVLTRGAMTLYHVPHLALGAELSENFEERTAIVAYRQIFGVVGGVTAIVLGFGWLLSDANGGRNNAEAYPTLAGIMAILMVITVWWSAWGTRREIPFLPQADPNAPRENVLEAVFRDLVTAVSNRSFRWLFGGIVIVFVLVGADANLATHMAQFFWELSGSQIVGLTVAPSLGILVGAFFTRAITTRYGKRFALLLGSSGWAVLQTLPVVLRLVGWFPENGSPTLIPLLIAMRALQGVLVAQAIVTFGAMLADIADENELATGKRQEGIFFGAAAFAGKATSGLGTGLAGFMISIIAMPLGAQIERASDIPPDTLFWLGIMCGPVLCVFSAVALWCYTHYDLDRERHASILAELQQRRTRAQSAATRSRDPHSTTQRERGPNAALPI